MKLYKYVDGERVALSASEAQSVQAEWAARVPTLEDIRARKKREVNEAYSAAMRPIAEKYPPEEREGWGEQIAAARDVKGGGKPMLIDDLRRNTGESAAQLASEIEAKRAEFLTVYGRHTGTKRGLMKQIQAAVDTEELEAVNIERAFV